MEQELEEISLDAIPEVMLDAIAYTISPNNVNSRVSVDFDLKMECILNMFNTNDYISVLFLLQNYIKKEEFLSIIRKEDYILKQKIITILKAHKDKSFLLIEILVVLKKYRSLRLLGTCEHVCNRKMHTFCQARKFWKFLYSLCEELTDSDVKTLSNVHIGQSSRNDLISAEEFFICIINPRESDYTNLIRLEKIFKDFNPSCYGLIKSYKEQIKMEYYIVKQPTSASFCGIAVIINHERFYRENENAPVLKDRDGSWKDIDALETVWKTFGFKTQIYCDLTDQEVVDLFEELRVLDHSSYDAFVACYLSHGNEDVVYASNSKGIYIRKLVDIMANHCHTLNKKPKLFFIQACQGHQMGFSSYQETAGVESAAHFPTSRIQPVSIHLQTNNSTDLPQFADTLIFNSTVKGFVSLRIPNEESWFVASIKNNMLEHGGDLTIDSILKKVSNEVSMKIGCFDQYKNLKQQPIMISTLRFELKLKKMCA